jgi:predicted Holliday junction resolvase-like endonuclease
VFFFALLVLYVVTHMNIQLTSELKSTIKSLQKELRKSRRQEEARRKMQLKGVKGTVGVQEHVEETGYGGTLVIDRSRW